MHDATIDPGLIRSLANLAAESDLSEIEVREGDLRIRLSRSSAAPRMPAPVPLSAAPRDERHVVTSPLVGTVSLSHGAGGRPFVEVGMPVRKGQRLLLVEAMRTFTEVAATRAGHVAAILVDHGRPVEYGEPLLVIA